MLIDIIAGARPNFMKIAPIIHEIERENKEAGLDISDKNYLQYRLIHTGQHYDRNMSGAFFEQLGIPEPDLNLESGSGSQSEQTGRIMTRYEKVLIDRKSDLCIVVGDVTSTMACSITAKKMGVKIAHVEGGIRSRDWTMPEEINRIATDSITDFFFTTSEVANKNLASEGVKKERIFFVGNTMIDTLLSNLDKLKKPGVFDEKSLKKGDFFVMTLHRPANVDEEKKLKSLIDNIAKGVEGKKIIFPVHPRTKKILDDLGISHENLIYTEPLGYLEFIWLIKHSKAVITDSGGITEETTVLEIPCLTLRDNTERPETVTQGTNELIGTAPEAIVPALKKLMSGNWKSGTVPEKWDGKASKRIVQSIYELLKDGQFKFYEPYVDHILMFKAEN
ncbi:UDP-N-acetylglucosamine 2-epimerase (non-hydrolyzing) [Rhodohalobacter sp. SW132]|uniref:non-hydrolyzing UDP-N-acetylglucosamine 2-epimerase n=1 Tax=Rhodohalobacter sp. SW132 TaxID=2293433 RepID=UPI000E22FD1C|nr:UDP-N-acetylglucosamine 2-epimerase (non-hydrolyzing) [Rhodohalobacter sp. SW132]REL38571.1 UDP-N-acetylglucosamine 2-epimerase (non-hydrolyzing) [Rhodohalobacter sp. SW132]